MGDSPQKTARGYIDYLNVRKSLLEKTTQTRQLNPFRPGVVRKKAFTHMSGRGSTRDAARQGSTLHGPRMTLRGDGANGIF